MACGTLTKSFMTVPCKGRQGGIQYAYFAPWVADCVDTYGITVVGKEVTLIDDTKLTEVFGYVVKSDAASANTELTTNDTGSRTLSLNTTIVLSFQNKDKDRLAEFDTLVNGTWLIFIGDANGEYRMYGAKSGCSSTAGNDTSGATSEDANGISVTFMCKEVTTAPLLAAAAVTTLKSIVV